MAPRNITNSLICKLVSNAFSVADSCPYLEDDSLSDWPGLAALAADLSLDRTMLFKQKFRTGGEWDFRAHWLKDCKLSGVEVGGRRYDHTMPGPFHYGYVGRAAGATPIVLYAAAGMPALEAGIPLVPRWCDLAEDPRDREFIRLGIKLFEDHAFSVTHTNLRAVLDEARDVASEPIVVRFSPRTSRGFAP